MNKKLKCKLCGKFFTKKWLITHIEQDYACFTNSLHGKHPHNKFLSNVLEKSKQNNRTLIVVASFSEEGYLMFKILPRLTNRNIHIINKSPLKQYSNSKIESKEFSEEIKPLKEYENATIAFDDILGFSSSKYNDHFFIRGRHNNSDIYYLSQSYFDLPERTLRNNSNKKICLIKH